MGAEAKCELRVDGATRRGNALLETDELLFREESQPRGRGVRVRIPLSSIREVRADAGQLLVHHAGGTAMFLLGDQAARWAERIRSPKSLLDKLGVKPDHVVSVIGLADEAFIEEVRQRAARVSVGRLAAASDLVFLGATSAKDLGRIAKAAATIARDGAIWVVHPKGPGALRDVEIFAEAKRIGLTYTKVARFSETHTAEKLVVPRAQR